MMYGFGGPQQIPGMMPTSGPKMAPTMQPAQMSMGQPNIRSRIASLMGGGNAVGATPLLRPTQPRQPMPISGGMGGPMRQMLR